MLLVAVLLNMSSQSLEQIAQNLVAPGKGILAADESNGTMSKRLEAVNVEPSEHTRRAYRTAMFSSEGIEEIYLCIINVIISLQGKSN